MRYGSVCSGIEAATAAWHPLGWTPAWFAEVEPFPSAVLAHHYPAVPNLGDITAPDFTERASEYGPIDVLVGGTPCQSFSVAGLRGGMADPRGNLALVFLAIADRLRPAWVVWENVPGVLSSNGGRDFGSILGGLAELGYGFAYRVLDAQHFGVPQRRRRVFVVGHLGDWRRATAVLFERDCLSGNPAPRRETGERVARSVIKGAAIGRNPAAGPQYGEILSDGSCYTLNCAEVHAVGVDLGTPALARCDTSREGGRQDFESETLIAQFDGHSANGIQFAPTIANTLDGDGRDGIVTAVTVPFDTTQLTSAANYSNPQPGDPCHPLAAGDHAPAVAFNWQAAGGINPGPVAPTLDIVKAGGTCDAGAARVAHPVATRGRDGETQIEMRDDGIANALRTPSGGRSGEGIGAALIDSAVRRLTPRECERLQGFTDDFTAVPFRGKPAADGPRYRALGNSMAVPVMHWIGERIAATAADGGQP